MACATRSTPDRRGSADDGNSDPADPRTDDIAGDVVVNGQVQADWGLHLIDVNLAMGNLVEIVGRQSKAYLMTGTKK